MSGYIGTQPVPRATRVLTQGEFGSPSSVISVPGGFTPRNIAVHINGIRLRESDYDDSTGYEIDLGEEFSEGTEYVIEEFRDFRVGDTDAKVGEHSDLEGGIHGIPLNARSIHSEELLNAVSTATTTTEAVSMTGKGAVVESGSTPDGHYVRWENGEQVQFGAATLPYDDTGYLGAHAPYATSFVGGNNGNFVSFGFPVSNASTTPGRFGELQSPIFWRTESGRINDLRVYKQPGAPDFGTEDTAVVQYTAQGFWK